MKTIIILFIILVVALAFGGLKQMKQNFEIEELEHKNNILEIDIAKRRITNYILEGQLYENRRYNLFQQALNEIDKNDYSEDYNCYEFTKDLQKELAKLDIFSVIAINKNRDHAFLLVGVEATEGRFLEVDNGYEIMEIRDSNLEVINL